MIRVKAKVRVSPGGRLEAEVGDALSPGEHEVEIVAPEESEEEKRRSQLDGLRVHSGPWPEGLSLRREDMYGDDGR